MSQHKPFHRNYREIKRGKNSGHGGAGYIRDRNYAKYGEHYVRALILIQNDLKTIFEYLEPSAECGPAFSYRIHALLMRTCIEVEANFKAILFENKFTATRQNLNMTSYRKVDASHHLSSYEVMLPIWNDKDKIFKPYEPWKEHRYHPCPGGVTLPWYKAYNASKHDRHEDFRKATFETLVMAV